MKISDDAYLILLAVITVTAIAAYWVVELLT